MAADRHGLFGELYCNVYKEADFRAAVKSGGEMSATLHANVKLPVPLGIDAGGARDSSEGRTL